MKYLLPLILCSCTTIPTQHGTARFWGNYDKISYRDGGVKVVAIGMYHGPIVKAHWHGITNLASEAVTGAIGLKDGNEVVGGVASVVTPIVNRPTTRTTP